MRRIGVEKIEDFAEWRFTDVLDIHGVGIGMARYIESELHRHGLAFLPDNAPFDIDVYLKYHGDMKYRSSK